MRSQQLCWLLKLGKAGLDRGILGSWVGEKDVLGNVKKGDYIRPNTNRIWKGVLDQHNWVGRATPYPSHDTPGTGPMA